MYERYCEPEGRKKCGAALEIYSLQRPIQRMDAGSTLRILDERRFEVVWSDDGWKTVNTDVQPGHWAAPGFSADIATQRPARRSWNGRCTGRNRTPGLDTM